VSRHPLPFRNDMEREATVVIGAAATALAMLIGGMGGTASAEQILDASFEFAEKFIARAEARVDEQEAVKP
jgi:hypothetical protein